MEYAELILDLTNNPESGTYIGNNCYKARIAIESKGKGKSGECELLLTYTLKRKSVYLLTIYNKGEKENLKPNELKIMIESLELE